MAGEAAGRDSPHLQAAAGAASPAAGQAANGRAASQAAEEGAANGSSVAPADAGTPAGEVGAGRRRVAAATALLAPRPACATPTLHTCAAVLRPLCARAAVPGRARVLGGLGPKPGQPAISGRPLRRVPAAAARGRCRARLGGEPSRRRVPAGPGRAWGHQRRQRLPSQGGQPWLGSASPSQHWLAPRRPAPPRLCSPDTLACCPPAACRWRTATTSTTCLSWCARS